MIAINLIGAASDDDKPQREPTVLVEIPAVGHEEAQNASDLVSIIQEKYGITDEDIDVLYNAMVCVYLRGKQLAKN